jgi:hypothetical protein
LYAAFVVSGEAVWQGIEKAHFRVPQAVFQQLAGD